MAKRFTDTEKWKRPWFRALPIKIKLLWTYICDECDIAGVWYVDIDLASFLIGEPITQEEALSYLSKQIEVLNGGGKWLIKDFVNFQYGVLVPTNNLHRSVLSRLEKLWAGQGLVSPRAGDKVMVKVINTTNTTNKRYDFESVWARYPNKDGKRDAERHFNRTVKTDKDYTDITVALENYCRSENVEKGFIKNGSTWFNNWRDWIVPPKADKIKTIEEKFGCTKKL